MTPSFLQYIKTLLLVDQSNFSLSLITIDSQSSLLSILHHSPTSILTLQIHKVLLELRQRNLKCSFLWVPSHRGIKENEIADREAKAALFNE